MADHNKELETHLKRLLDEDKKRQKNPMGGKIADEAMMALCQFLKDHQKTLDAATREKTIKTLKGMNLRPYWNYCREHMLDIGLDF